MLQEGPVKGLICEYLKSSAGFGSTTCWLCATTTTALQKQFFGLVFIACQLPSVPTRKSKNVRKMIFNPSFAHSRWCLPLSSGMTWSSTSRPTTRAAEWSWPEPVALITATSASWLQTTSERSPTFMRMRSPRICPADTLVRNFSNRTSRVIYPPEEP